MTGTSCLQTSPDPAGPDREALLLFLGDYSTPRFQAAKVYWLVTREPAGDFRVKSLNQENLPAGVCRRLPEDEFMVAFTPEPEHFVEHTFPALKRFLTEHRDQPEALEPLREIGLSAEDSEGVAQAVERILRHLGERAGQLKFDQSRELSLYSMKLRKQGRYEDALAYCRKAFEITPGDENIFFNMARVHLEMGERDRALRCVRYALTLNPNFKPALKFQRFLERTPGQ
jgi:tetratricopeptide (TPR) repeat protein